MAKKNYNDYSKGELIELLKARDRREATRFGLVVEANEIERDKALNADFVALDLVPELSCPAIKDGKDRESVAEPSYLRRNEGNLPPTDGNPKRT